MGNFPSPFIVLQNMDWNQIEFWEIVGAIVVITVLVFQLFPLFINTKKELENNYKSNPIENSKGLLNKVKKHKWQLSGTVIITVSLIIGLKQKSLLFGLSICASLNYLLSHISTDYMESAFGSNRFIVNLISGFYTIAAFLVMILFWFLYSRIG